MVTMTERTVTGKAVRASATRELILTTAERLFAQHGLAAVSNRQVSEAAGQGNNAAVGYHFGTKADLVRAIVHKHADHIEELRTRMLAQLGDSADVRDWVGCLVRPIAEHLAALGNPTWFARFNAQMMTDPAFRAIMVEEGLSSPSLRRIIDGLNRCVSDLPVAVRSERSDMAGLLLVHSFAGRERALAERLPTPRASWDGAATGLIDAIVGLWMAPVTPHC